MTRQAQKLRQEQRRRRALRVRSKLHGTATQPRLSVARSNKAVFVQAINDDAGVSLVGIGENKARTGTKMERAVKVAKQVAESLKKAGVTSVIFDRGSYRYHGRVKAIAETLREAGIKF